MKFLFTPFFLALVVLLSVLEDEFTSFLLKGPSGSLWSQNLVSFLFPLFPELLLGISDLTTHVLVFSNLELILQSLSFSLVAMPTQPTRILFPSEAVLMWNEWVGVLQRHKHPAIAPIHTLPVTWDREGPTTSADSHGIPTTGVSSHTPETLSCLTSESPLKNFFFEDPIF